MTKKRILTLIGIALVMISLPMGIGLARSTQSGKADLLARQERLQKTRITTVQRRAAAARFKQLRQAALSKKGATSTLGTSAMAAAMAMPDPGGVPHYFGPYPNYANSPLPKGPITAVTLVSGGQGYTAPTVMIDDLYGTGGGAIATASFVPNGPIIGITVGDPGAGYSAPIVYILDPTGTGADATAAIGGSLDSLTGGIRKFVDSLPGLNAAGTNNLGQYIPVAIPDTAAYPGDDYYEIELGQYSERLHSDLPPTLLRGYRQTNTGDATVGQFHYLGPLIVAQRDRPVRIKFTNSLPTGMGGNLFIPVDTTVMGAGMGPTGMMYTENRATIHLHGGYVPWISDGTPHQWTTPAGDSAAYPTGVSVYNVPDMPNPGANPPPGELTFYYNNQQSARLMFYHDHAFGITRLNVYAGEAAGYLLTDAVEQDLINGTNVTGVNPGQTPLLPSVGIPLIIQDKTFVDAATIAAQDPTWNWGSMPGMPMTGDLWMPHVYMPNQNPADLSGMNAFGRWHYGPWFWPPTTNITNPPIANLYYDPINAPWEYSLMPATPNPSMAMEAYMDTPLVNGTAYPYLELEPKSYRFRILNACNDRFVNLQFYVADDAVTTADGRTLTEVKMVPAVLTPGFPEGWPIDSREGGAPDPITMGPSFIQIGTEGGFLPAPVVVPNQPIDWNLNPTTFNFGNVSSHALLLGTAERADVIVDFSAYAGKTIILYNDAPAAFPALDTRYDYYTGNPDQTGGGGAPTTQPGYGPNTRTVMQIRVAGTPAAPYDLTALEQAFARTDAKRGVFEVSQDPVLVPQAAYDSAYNAAFPADPYVRIFEESKAFQTLGGTMLTLPLQPKAIQDEQGEAFDSEYGRMSGFLGVQLPAQAGQQRFTLFPYASPPIELVAASMTPMSPMAGDGTQLWKITHNGVDTHTLHFHLFNVQLVNRVAWDNAVSAPDANELGWKETIRVNPLEDTIVALRPVAPTQDFDIPNSIRPIDVTMPLGEILVGGPGGFKDPLGNPVTVLNHEVNFGWEYVLHCHLLGHEEMDMMHGMAFVIAPEAPTGLVGVMVGNGNRRSVDLTWTDNSPNETGFTIQRAADDLFTTGLVSVGLGPNVTAYTDTSVSRNLIYYYRIFASNVVGDIDTVGFPIMTAESGFSNSVMIGADPTPADPTNLTASLQAGPSVLLSWTDNADNETGFVIERALNGGAFAPIATPGPFANTGLVTFTDTTVTGGNTYVYQVKAVRGTISSLYSNAASIAVPDAPAAPSNVTAAGVPRNNNRSRINVAWTDNSTNETGFTLQYATSIDFTTGVVTINLPVNTTTYQTGNLPRNTSYYVRVRSVNGTLPSIWVNATPFPVITP
jgi:FtsP/CotA-like multicopper oxidase with cupredoxin domain